MTKTWASSPSGDRYSVPVEMRFIDMFMAALGALIFMAMLLAYLVPKIPAISNSPLPDQPKRALSLHIITKSLPPARLGERYELPLAYRGGTGLVTWELAAGKNGLPNGLKFDAQGGILVGTAGAMGTSRFVIRARDSSGATTDISYELVVDSARPDPRKPGRWLAYAMLVGLLLLTVTLRSAARDEFKTVALCREAAQLGQAQYNKPTGQGKYEVVILPDGIPTLIQTGKGLKRASNTFLLLSLAMAGWIVWRVWLG